MKLTKKQITQDERILAEILTANEVLGRPVLTNGRERVGLFNYHGFAETRTPDGPCCAVGAGCLYRGMTAEDLDEGETKTPSGKTLTGAFQQFADLYGVSVGYAVGVSDGFERIGDTPHDTPEFFGLSREDYDRGLDVGEAVFQALNSGEP